MNKIFVISFTVSAVLLLLLFTVLFSVYGHQINVTALNVLVYYIGSCSGYLGSPTQSYPFNITVSSGQVFYVTLTFKSGALFRTHEITAITVNTPGFQLISVSPPLPVPIAPGGEVTITLEIQAPYTSYTGPLTISVYTR